MDVLNALAPYASRPLTAQQFTLDKKFQLPNTSARPVIQFVSKPAASAVPSKVITRSTTRNLATKAPPPPGPAQAPVPSREGNKFSVYHKKANLQFTARDPQSLANNRKLNYKESVKDRRAKVMNSNRRITDSLLMESRLTTTTTEVLPVAKPKLEQAKTTRMEQLQRWKRERDELAKQKLKPLPFKKTEAVSHSGQQKKENQQPLGPMKNPSGYVNSGQKENKPIAAIKKIGVAQSKTQQKENQPQQAVITKKKSEFDSVPPPLPVQKEIQAPIVVVPANIVENASNSSEQQENQPLLPFKKLPGICHSPQYKGNQNQPLSVKKVLGGVAHSPGMISRVKKSKGMLFDSVYKEYNGKFVTECSALLDCSDRWTDLLLEDKNKNIIPEEFLCDIESSVGQAKLLLDSKLPQFAELLYFYLSRTLNPHPILACDLEGWWDVAMISIDKVKDRFVKLEKLAKNRWMPGERIPLKIL